MELQEGTVAPDGAASTEAAEVVGAPGPEGIAGETPASQPTGINPAWEPLREAIGDEFFQGVALPILSDMDKSAHTRITNLNAQLKGYEGYKPFVEQGLSPDEINRMVKLNDWLSTDPQGFYNEMGTHFNFASQAEEEEPEGLDAFGAGQENAAEIPPHIQAQLDQFREFQEQQVAAQEQQAQQEAYQAEFDSEMSRLETEMTEFLRTNPTFTVGDRAELTRIQLELTRELSEQGINRTATVAEAAAKLTERAAYYAGRGGQQAPNTFPTTSGGSVQQKPVDTSKMSKQEITDYTASILTAAAAQQ